MSIWVKIIDTQINENLAFITKVYLLLYLIKNYFCSSGCRGWMTQHNYVQVFITGKTET